MSWITSFVNWVVIPVAIIATFVILVRIFYPAIFRRYIVPAFEGSYDPANDAVQNLAALPVQENVPSLIIDPATGGYRIDFGDGRSLEHGTVHLHVKETWYSSAIPAIGPRLEKVGQDTSTIQTRLGKAEATTLHWQVPGTDIKLDTIFHRYPGTSHVIFEACVPGGIDSLGCGSYGEPTIAFPCFENASPNKRVLCYKNQVFSPAQRDFTFTTSPACFFDDDRNAFIISALDHFITHGVKKEDVGDKIRISCGPNGLLEKVPPGHASSYLLVFGRGINATFLQWGELLRQQHESPAKDRYVDVITSKIGYFTDNGGSNVAQTVTVSIATYGDVTFTSGAVTTVIPSGTVIASRQVPLAKWNDLGDNGYAVIEFNQRTDLPADTVYEIIIDAGAGKKIPVNVSLNGYDEGKMVWKDGTVLVNPSRPQNTANPPLQQFIFDSRDINFLVHCYGNDTFSIESTQDTPAAIEPTSTSLIKQTFKARERMDCVTLLRILVPESIWTAEYEAPGAPGTWDVVIANTTTVVSNDTYTFNMAFSETGGWLEIPLSTGALTNNSDYWFQITRADTYTYPIKVCSVAGTRIADGSVWYHDGSTMANYADSDVYFVMEYQKADEDSILNEMTYTYNAMATEQEFYIMGADEYATKVRASVIIEYNTTAVLDPRADKPDSVRLDRDAMLYWTDLDGDGIYEGGFVFPSELLWDETLDTWPLACGYFVDYNGDQKFNTERFYYEDGQFGDRFFAFSWLATQSKFQEYRQKAYDQAYKDYLDQTVNDPNWWIQQIINTLAVIAIMVVSALCGPFSSVVSIALFFAWSFASSAIAQGFQSLKEMSAAAALQNAKAIEIARTDPITSRYPYANTEVPAYGQFGHAGIAIPRMAFELARAIAGPNAFNDESGSFWIFHCGYTDLLVALGAASDLSSLTGLGLGIGLAFAALFATITIALADDQEMSPKYFRHVLFGWYIGTEIPTTESLIATSALTNSPTYGWGLTKKPEIAIIPLVSADGRITYTYLTGTEGSSLSPYRVTTAFEGGSAFSPRPAWDINNRWPDPTTWWNGLPQVDLAYFVNYQITCLAAAYYTGYQEARDHDWRICLISVAAEVIETVITILAGSYLTNVVTGKIGTLGKSDGSKWWSKTGKWQMIRTGNIGGLASALNVATQDELEWLASQGVTSVFSKELIGRFALKVVEEVLEEQLLESLVQSAYHLLVRNLLGHLIVSINTGNWDPSKLLSYDSRDMFAQAMKGNDWWYFLDNLLFESIPENLGEWLGNFDTISKPYNKIRAKLNGGTTTNVDVDTEIQNLLLAPTFGQTQIDYKSADAKKLWKAGYPVYRHNQIISIMHTNLKTDQRIAEILSAKFRPGKEVEARAMIENIVDNMLEFPTVNLADPSSAEPVDYSIISIEEGIEVIEKIMGDAELLQEGGHISGCRAIFKSGGSVPLEMLGPGWLFKDLFTSAQIEAVLFVDPASGNYDFVTSEQVDFMLKDKEMGPKMRELGFKDVSDVRQAFLMNDEKYANELEYCEKLGFKEGESDRIVAMQDKVAFAYGLIEHTIEGTMWSIEGGISGNSLFKPDTTGGKTKFVLNSDVRDALLQGTTVKLVTPVKSPEGKSWQINKIDNNRAGKGYSLADFFGDLALEMDYTATDDSVEFRFSGRAFSSEPIPTIMKGKSPKIQRTHFDTAHYLYLKWYGLWSVDSMVNARADDLSTYHEKKQGYLSAILNSKLKLKEQDVLALGKIMDKYMSGTSGAILTRTMLLWPDLIGMVGRWFNAGFSGAVGELLPISFIENQVSKGLKIERPYVMQELRTLQRTPREGDARGTRTEEGLPSEMMAYEMKNFGDDSMADTTGKPGSIPKSVFAQIGDMAKFLIKNLQKYIAKKQKGLDILKKVKPSATVLIPADQVEAFLGNMDDAALGKILFIDGKANFGERTGCERPDKLDNSKGGVMWWFGDKHGIPKIGLDGLPSAGYKKPTANDPGIGIWQPSRSENFFVMFRLVPDALSKQNGRFKMEIMAGKLKIDETIPWNMISSDSDAATTDGVTLADRFKHPTSNYYQSTPVFGIEVRNGFVIPKLNWDGPVFATEGFGGTMVQGSYLPIEAGQLIIQPSLPGYSHKEISAINRVLKSMVFGKTVDVDKESVTDMLEKKSREIAKDTPETSAGKVSALRMTVIINELVAAKVGLLDEKSTVMTKSILRQAYMGDNLASQRVYTGKESKYIPVKSNELMPFSEVARFLGYITKNLQPSHFYMPGYAVFISRTMDKAGFITRANDALRRFFGGFSTVAFIDLNGFIMGKGLPSALGRFNNDIPFASSHVDQLKNTLNAFESALRAFVGKEQCSEILDDPVLKQLRTDIITLLDSAVANGESFLTTSPPKGYSPFTKALYDKYLALWKAVMSTGGLLSASVLESIPDTFELADGSYVPYKALLEATSLDVGNIGLMQIAAREGIFPIADSDRNDIIAILEALADKVITSEFASGEKTTHSLTPRVVTDAMFEVFKSNDPGVPGKELKWQITPGRWKVYNNRAYFEIQATSSNGDVYTRVGYVDLDQNGQAFPIMNGFYAFVSPIKSWGDIFSPTGSYIGGSLTGTLLKPKVPGGIDAAFLNGLFPS